MEMLNIVLSGRADYFFVSEEEAEQVIEMSGHDRSRFQLNIYSDMPPGNFRYIACSMQVSPATVEALNAGLR
jgi:polar amino acid transport system substrate-binding protein